MPTLDSSITAEEVIQSINNCKSNKASGLDGITNDFIKAVPENWVYYLVILFNKILETETFLSNWSKAQNFMLYKKGQKSDPNNYRGI